MSLIWPTIIGLTIPPTCPNVLMSAVPPAAPAPAPTKTLGGKFQKEGIAATIPAPNKASEMTTTTGFASKKPAVKKPIAPKESKPAVNFKRSPDLSAKRPTMALLQS